MSPFVNVLCWAPVGVGASLLHSCLLWRAINRISGLASTDAGKRIAQGVPRRLLLLLPILAVVAWQGLEACVGFIVGYLSGRWLVGFYSVKGCRGPLVMPEGQGSSDGH